MTTVRELVESTAGVIGDRSHARWLVEVAVSVDRVDDVLDEGKTLNHLKDWAFSEGAREVRTVVLSRKIVENQEHMADYVGLESPNKFLFGCGMDLYGYGRNLPSIYGF